MNKSETLTVIEMRGVAIGGTQRPDIAEVEGVNWRATHCDFWIIGGLQGSGKTGFISTAAGLQRPLAGSVEIFGKDFFTLHEAELLEERRKVGVVFENNGRTFSRLTVYENVALPLRYHHDWSDDQAQAEVERLLEFTGLTRFAREPVSLLSPSFQQRTGLARALALRPEILLLDKPLVASRDRRWWPELLKQLNDGSPLTGGRPMTIVVTTEDLQVWGEFGKQFAVLSKKGWHVLGSQSEFAEKMQPILNDFWSDDFTEE